MSSRASTALAAVCFLGMFLLVVPGLLMVMVMTGARTELPRGGCGENVSAAGDYASGDDLNQAQLANASSVISVGLRLGVPQRGIVVALATAHQESRFLNYANDGLGSDLKPDQAGIRQSLSLTHQAVGSDHGSLGIFQQQWPWWGAMDELMNPGVASQKFFERLLMVPGWQSMSVTAAAQAVQRSAFPSAYADDEALAVKLMSDPGLGSGSVSEAAWTGESTADLCATDVSFAGDVVIPVVAGRSRDLHNFGANSGRWARGHTGTDLSAPCGTPVVASHAGRISIDTDQSWSGPWLVKVTTGRGKLTTWYAHMQLVLVDDGQVVRAGETIGQVGQLGNASGCHLHFEVHPQGGSIYQDDVDPTEWLKLHAGSTPTDVVPVSSASSGFVVASLNVLGHSHTKPGGDRPGYAPSAQRLQWAVEALDRYAVEVVGLQEFEPPQRDTMVKIAGSRYAVYSPRGNTANSIAWRRDKWAFVSADTFAIPYFNGVLQDMPILRLRRLSTGSDVIFLNIHNAANTARFPRQEAFRREALRREVAVLQALTTRYDVPVIITGDFNDRAPAFCSLTAGGLVTASAGGSNLGRCSPPPRPEIDWIFGSGQVRWKAYSSLRHGFERRVTDHPLALARASTAE